MGHERDLLSCYHQNLSYWTHFKYPRIKQKPKPLQSLMALHDSPGSETHENSQNVALGLLLGYMDNLFKSGQAVLSESRKAIAQDFRTVRGTGSHKCSERLGD